MMHTTDVNSPNLKKIQVWGSLAALLLFCVFAVFYERHVHDEARAKIDEHARVIAAPLWNYNYRAASEYLNLARSASNYETLVVVETEGGVFYEAPPMEHETMDQFLVAFRFVPKVPLATDVVYEGETIGRVRAVWIPRSIYIHAAFFVFFLMGVALFILYTRIFQAKRMLEERVQERTSALADANTRLQNEIREREQSEKQLRRAQSIARLGSWRVDLATRKTDLCPEACKIYGIDECSGTFNRELRQIPLPEYRAMLNKKLKKLLHGESEYEEAEFRIQRPEDGRIIDIYTVGEYNPKNNTISGTIQDITERKQAEAEMQKLERLKTVGMLAGGIAHDFNNILTGIFGNISVVRSKLENGHPALDAIEKAERSMDRAIRLTNQLLTFAKGGLPVREDARLDHIVEEVVRFDLSGSNVMPVFQSSEDLRLAKVDKGQVQQVFSNLAINADRAMPGGGRLYISLENAEVPEASPLPLSPGKYIKAEVRDEGIGIAPEHLEYIFDPYYSIRQNGSGLGLATVYSIMEKHGGHISVASEPAKGTTFTLYLPASEATRPAEARTVEKDAPNVKYAVRVLVMDDEDMIRNVASDMLKTCGCKVETTADGRETVKLYREAMDTGNAFDMVIMDMTVPGGMGGVEAVQEILAIDPEARVVVSSGYADNAALGNYADYGFMDILSKPYTLARLRNVLHRVLSEREG